MYQYFRWEVTDHYQLISDLKCHREGNEKAFMNWVSCGVKRLCPDAMSCMVLFVHILNVAYDKEVV